MEAAGFIVRLRTRLRTVLLVEGLARLVATAIAACAGAVALDYVFRLPGPLRLLLLIGVVSSIGLLIRRRLQAPLGRAMDDRTLANLVERRLPALDGRLLSGIDGIALSEGDHRTLAEQLSPGALRTLVPARALPWYALAALAGLALVVGAGFGAPQAVSSGAARLFLPFGSATWQRSDTLEGRIEHAVVPADEPLVVEIRRVRGDEAALHLAWRDAAHAGVGDHRTLEGLQGPWRHPLSLPPGTWAIDAASGDADPLTLSGRVVARPRLEEVVATLTPPAYAEAEPQHLGTLTCTALPGSTLEFAVRFAMESDRRAERIALTLGGAPVAAERSERGLHGSLRVTAGGELVVDVLDQDGIGANPPPHFTLTLAEDRAPIVALDGARNNEAVTPQARLAIKVDARDDFGLGELILDAQALPAPKDGETVEPKPGERRTIVRFPEVGGFATTRPATVAVGDQAAIGERLLLIGVAKDRNDVSGPGVGQSEPLQLRVVSEEDLRRELDRLIAEARERVTQARDELSRAHAKSELLTPASRNAGLAARRASETLAAIIRRWRDNQLPADQVEPEIGADRALKQRAMPALTDIPGAADKAPALAETADQALGEAERLLAGLLQDGDLARDLSSVLGRERALHDDSKAFAREFLAKPLDEPGKQRQEALAARQKDLAEQMKTLERKLLASQAKQLAPAQELARAEQPADALAQAGQQLGSKDQRPQGVQRQEAAIATMEKLLALIQGSNAAKDLADQAGALARDQEQLGQELDQGAAPGALRERQDEVRKRTAELLKKVQDQATPNAEAGKSLQGAGESQQSAGAAMGGGDRSGAGLQSAAAAAQLREAQKQLGGAEQQPEKPKDKKSADVMALLKELKVQQVKVVTDASALDRRIGEGALDFAAKRDLAAIADLQGEIALRLVEEGIKELEGHGIALAALARVRAAMEKAQARFESPALGEKGVRLAKVALYELTRLIDIADHLPQSEDSGKQGNSGGGGQQAPFPPQAELGLLRGMEEEIAARTAANAPGDLPAAQQQVRDLVALLEGATRPGTRPAVLLARVDRALASAQYLLKQDDRGLTTRHEQEAAIAALTRLLQEAERSGGGSGGSGQNQPPQGGQDGASPPPSAGDAAPAGGGNAESGSAKQGDQSKGRMDAGAVDGAGIGLPPEARERLRQARELNLPPAALKLYERYLEELESQP